jgi:hypothetical protein
MLRNQNETQKKKQIKYKKEIDNFVKSVWGLEESTDAEYDEFITEFVADGFDVYKEMSAAIKGGLKEGLAVSDHIQLALLMIEGESTVDLN